jgi:hypothetical protein
MLLLQQVIIRYYRKLFLSIVLINFNSMNTSLLCWPLFVTNESLLMISIYLEVEHYRHRTSWSTAFCSFAWSRWRLAPWRRSCRSSSRSRRTSPECRRSTRSRRCSNIESRFGRNTLSVGPDHRFIHNNYVNQIA